MARLFITPRELNFISDITKEIIRDVNAQKIYYYPISELKTQAHPVYAEAIKKIFDQPIIIDAFVDSNFQGDTKINKFGVDAQYKIEVYMQHRDLLEKGVNVTLGDYFSFSDCFYEITEKNIMRNIYGQAEHQDGVRLVGTKVRESQFKALTLGPTDISRPEDDAVQKLFNQTRGEAESADGPTGDVRDLVKAGVLDPPLSGPREVSERGGSTEDADYSGSAFYDDE